MIIDFSILHSLVVLQHAFSWLIPANTNTFSNWQLFAALVSRDKSKIVEFHRKLKIILLYGKILPRNITQFTFVGGTVFCSERDADLYISNVEQILTFPTQLYMSGLSYSAISTARNALSSFLCKEKKGEVPVSQLPIVVSQPFLKGIFNSRPSLPKTNTVWDTTVVLRYLTKLPDLTLHLSLYNNTITDSTITIKMGTYWNKPGLAVSCLISP